MVKYPISNKECPRRKERQLVLQLTPPLEIGHSLLDIGYSTLSGSTFSLGKTVPNPHPILFVPSCLRVPRLLSGHTPFEVDWAIGAFTRPATWDKFSSVSTITATLEADADGTLHLPVPRNLRRGKVKVIATLETEPQTTDRPTREMALTALRQLRRMGTFQNITDPVAWQREIRKDSPLPGRS